MPKEGFDFEDKANQSIITEVAHGPESLTDKVDDSLEAEINTLKSEGGKIGNLLVQNYTKNQLNRIKVDIIEALGYGLADVKDDFIEDKLGFHLAIDEFLQIK